MNPEKTMEAVRSFCKANSGSEYIWSGNKNTYRWTRGKTTRAGVVNGVVRKLLDINVGEPLWVVAGSFKILPDGKITRFTGLHKTLQDKVQQKIPVEELL